MLKEIKELKRDYFFWIVIILGVLFILFTNQAVFMNFRLSPDESSYITQAQIFAMAKRYVPSFEPREFFDANNFMNNGKYYSKYSPGWPFFLMFGFLVGMPQIVNLLFGLGTLLLVYLIAKKLTSIGVAKVTLLLMVVSPYFLMNSASYLSHTSTLFFVVGAVYLFLEGTDTKKDFYFFLGGICIGVLFSIRELDAVIVGFALFLNYFHLIYKEKLKWDMVSKHILFFIVGLAPFFVFYFVDNHYLTGDALTSSFSQYDPSDKMGFSQRFTIFDSINNHLYERGILLIFWMPFSLFIVFYSILFPKKNTWFLLSILFSVMAAYMFYHHPGGYQYGPRYWYSLSFVVFILTAQFVESIKGRKKLIIFSVFVLANLILYLTAAIQYHQELSSKKTIMDVVKSEKISNALIFLDCLQCGGVSTPKDITLGILIAL
jgi:4-amino-4-deoxy-L-arabinose transferase-like glycosyltransferase